MNNLEAIRKEKGLTLQEVGEMINLSKQRVCMLENNRLKPENAKKCAKALDKNVFEVMGLDALALIPETQEDKKTLIKTINSIPVRKNEKPEGVRFVLKTTNMTDYELKDYYDGLYNETMDISRKIKTDNISAKKRKELCDELLMTLFGLRLATGEAFKRLLNE